MISELILLHEEMIVQLRVECEEAVDNVDFIRGMIEQHGQTAAMLRAKLENDETDTTSDCVIAGTRFTAEKSLVAIRARRGRA